MNNQNMIFARIHFPRLEFPTTSQGVSFLDNLIGKILGYELDNWDVGRGVVKTLHLRSEKDNGIVKVAYASLPSNGPVHPDIPCLDTLVITYNAELTSEEMKQDFLRAGFDLPKEGIPNIPIQKRVQVYLNLDDRLKGTAYAVIESDYITVEPSSGNEGESNENKEKQSIHIPETAGDATEGNAIALEIIDLANDSLNSLHRSEKKDHEGVMSGAIARYVLQIDRDQFFLGQGLPEEAEAIRYITGAISTALAGVFGEDPRPLIGYSLIRHNRYFCIDAATSVSGERIVLPRAELPIYIDPREAKRLTAYLEGYFMANKDLLTLRA